MYGACMGCLVRLLIQLARVARSVLCNQQKPSHFLLVQCYVPLEEEIISLQTGSLWGKKV